MQFKQFEIFKNKDLDFFVNSESLNLFDRFNISKDFLKLNVDDWSKSEDYLKGVKIFKNMQVVNDCAERAVHLCHSFVSDLTKNENQKQCIF